MEEIDNDKKDNNDMPIMIMIMTIILMIIMVIIMNHHHKKHNVIEETCQLPLEIKLGKKRINTFNCKKGSRIKITRDNLFHILIHHQQKSALHKHQNNRNFHGTMLSGN